MEPQILFNLQRRKMEPDNMHDTDPISLNCSIAVHLLYNMF